MVSFGEAVAGGVSSRLSRLERKSSASSALVFLFFGGILMVTIVVMMMLAKSKLGLG